MLTIEYSMSGGTPPENTKHKAEKKNATDEKQEQKVAREPATDMDKLRLDNRAGEGESRQRHGCENMDKQKNPFTCLPHFSPHCLRRLPTLQPTRISAQGASVLPAKQHSLDVLNLLAPPKAPLAFTSLFPRLPLQFSLFAPPRPRPPPPPVLNNPPTPGFRDSRTRVLHCKKTLPSAVRRWRQAPFCFTRRLTHRSRSATRDLLELYCWGQRLPVLVGPRGGVTGRAVPGAAPPCWFTPA